MDHIDYNNKLKKYLYNLSKMKMILIILYYMDLMDLVNFS